MPYPLDDTIAAIASPLGGGARGILRLSGPNVRVCLEQVFRVAELVELGAITRASVVPGVILLGNDAPPLPGDLYWWPGPRSYTGQPTAEIHTFGCQPLLEAALRRICRSGSRLAEPGEFTLRAFLGGRIDLTQAEAVLGVVDAADSRQFDVALAQLAGGLGGPLHQLRDALIELLAQLEAGFDFPDEELPFITRGELAGQLTAAAETVARLARQMVSRGEAADRVWVVLVGWPNTGKSSLFNALVGKSGALVSGEPGTTRDYLTAELDLDGAKCLLVDTAGIEPAPEGPDAELRHAARAASERQSQVADVRLFCLDSTRPLNAWERGQLAAGSPDRLLVLTKIDLQGESRAEEGARSDSPGPTWGRSPPEGSFAQAGPVSFFLRTSSRTGEGIDALRSRLRDAVLTRRASGGDVVATTAVRCGESLRRASISLEHARETLRGEVGEELVAAEIRVALEELGKVVGAVYTEDILDRVFSRFCIGK
jgi:tRNA modification GTPase